MALEIKMHDFDPLADSCQGCGVSRTYVENHPHRGCPPYPRLSDFKSQRRDLVGLGYARPASEFDLEMDA